LTKFRVEGAKANWEANYDITGREGRARFATYDVISTTGVSGFFSLALGAKRM
jgi:hypothetical protein